MRKANSTLSNLRWTRRKNLLRVRSIFSRLSRTLGPCSTQDALYRLAVILLVTNITADWGPRMSARGTMRG